MKRFLICFLAVCLMLAVFTGCSATGRVDPYGMYGNVSTTNDGRVNGTNNYYSGTNGQTRGGTNDRAYNGTNGQSYQGMTGQAQRGATGQAGTNSYTGTQRGTGMAGSR